MEDIQKVFGQFLRARLVSQRYTQKSLAEKIGVTEQSMHAWVNGTQNITLPHLFKIVKVLDFDVREIPVKLKLK